MKRELKVGVAVVGAVIGLLGWSVAGGIANRPAGSPPPAALVPRAEAPPAEVAASAAKDQEAVPNPPCCKEGAKHGADHAHCKMKAGAAHVPEPSVAASKCPYLAGRAASSPGETQSSTQAKDEGTSRAARR